MTLTRSIFWATAVVAAHGSLLRSSSMSFPAARFLSQEKIAGYEPTTVVTDHNAIDLDQQVIEKLVAQQTDSSFAQAYDVYSQGAFSRSVAEVTLDTPLTSGLAVNAAVTGKAVDGSDVAGFLYAAANSGDNMLQVQYQTSSVQSDYVRCQVGANPEPKLDGCLSANGTITVGGSTFSYNYDPETDNKNKRTLQGFSTGADTKMRRFSKSTESYYADFQKFVDYYGEYDYGDTWVSAALQGEKADFPGKGDADFSSYNLEARAEAAKKGTVFLNLAMYTIREFEDALDNCDEGCATDECTVSSLDEGVAFYVGSLQGTDGSGSGYLMYSLANKRCINFRTCGDNGDSTSGTALINIQIIKEFEKMQANLKAKDCAAARVNKEYIVSRMMVPLVQGTLRYAYITDRDPEATTKGEAEGATFAAAVLPMVAACNSADADTIYNNMKVGQGFTADFATVKSAFERNYACMGMSCSDIGGLYDDANGVYMTGAERCGQPTSSASNSGNDSKVGLAVGLSVGGAVTLALLAMFILRRRSSSSGVEFKSDGVSGV